TNMMLTALGRSWEVETCNEADSRAFSDHRLRSLDDAARLVEQSAAPVVIFKPLMDTCLARKMLDRFEDSKFLFPFRHFDDVVNSMIRKAHNDGEPNHHLARVGRWVEQDFAL